MIQKVTDHYTLPYSLGGLLYTPAVNESFADKLISGELGQVRSAALCLEDAILDSGVEEAQNALVRTLRKLYEYGSADSSARLPFLFVRVRSPEHLMSVHKLLGGLEEVLCGYILPKFDASNGQSYIEGIERINQGPYEIFALPILESRRIADRHGRAFELSLIKHITDKAKNRVIGIRVGGNDFCSLYGVRRTVAQTVYDIGVVRDIITDIINVFSFDHVVSAPVWEYFGESGGEWQRGLERELSLDLLNGFVGKTAIHPAQLPVIHKALSVSRGDYEDALKIINWSGASGVGKSSDGGRMNEVKCHRRWAQKIKTLGDIYGIRD